LFTQYIGLMLWMFWYIAGVLPTWLNIYCSLWWN
jgi:hypothetical protein